MMRSKISWVDNVHFRANTESGHEIDIDGPPDSGGQNRGARPMELMLLGLGGCTSFDVVSILRKGRQSITGCEAEIEAERAQDDPRVFTRIHVHFTIRGHDVNPDKVQRAIELTARKYCSASIMLERGGVAISHDFEIIDEAADEAAP